VYERPLVARRTYLCLGMVRPGLARALGSDFRARCEMGLEIKQRPMDDLGLCALGPILMCCMTIINNIEFVDKLFKLLLIPLIFK